MTLADVRCIGSAPLVTPAGVPRETQFVWGHASCSEIGRGEEP